VSLGRRRRRRLSALVRWSFEDSDGTYGYRRVHAHLASSGGAVGGAGTSAQGGQPLVVPMRSAKMITLVSYWWLLGSSPPQVISRRPAALMLP